MYDLLIGRIKLARRAQIGGACRLPSCSHLNFRYVVDLVDIIGVEDLQIGLKQEEKRLNWIFEHV